MRFVTNEGSPPPRHRTASWSSGNQVLSNSRPGPLPLEVWAPSLTLGRDGPGIILKDGKGPIRRKGLETAMTDFYTNQKPTTSQPTLSAVSAQFSPSRYVGFMGLEQWLIIQSWKSLLIFFFLPPPHRHRVAATHLAQTDSELSLLQGELVLVHRPRPDGRVLVTQESSGQTGFFQSSILQSLERLSWPCIPSVVMYISKYHVLKLPSDLIDLVTRLELQRLMLPNDNWKVEGVYFCSELEYG